MSRIAWPTGAAAPAGWPPREEVDVAAGARPAPGCRSSTWAAGRTRSRLLRRRLRRRGQSVASEHDTAPSECRSARLQTARRLEPVEERRLGPVVGLGTWNTFGGDEGLAGRVVGARSTLDRGSSTRRRCTAARSGRSARRRRPARRRDRGHEGLERVGRRGTRAVLQAARLVRRQDRARAGPQPRRVAPPRGLAGGGAGRRAHRPHRRDALRPACFSRLADALRHAASTRSSSR